MQFRVQDIIRFAPLHGTIPADFYRHVGDSRYIRRKAVVGKAAVFLTFSLCDVKADSGVIPLALKVLSLGAENQEGNM